MKYLFVYRNIRYGGCEFLIEKITRELKSKNSKGEIVCVCEFISKEMEESLKNNDVKIYILTHWDNLQNYIENQRERVNIIAFEWKDFINVFYSKGKNKKTMLYAVHPRAISGCGDNDDVRTHYLNVSRDFIFRLAEKRHIVVMDETVRRETGKYYKKEIEMEILRICVDVRELVKKKDINAVLEAPIVLTVARAEFPFKGYLIGLIRWFGSCKLDKLKLKIVTFGRDYDDIVCEINKLEDTKIKKITLINKLPHEKLMDLYKEATVYVGMGTSVLESALSKIPTVPIRPDTFELLCNGRFDENPNYVCGDDSLEWKEFSKCITEILTMDAIVYNKVGEIGYEAVCKIYDTKVIVDRLEKMFSKCSYDYQESADAITDMSKEICIINEMIKRKLDDICKIKDRNIYIWGVGVGGKDVFFMLKKRNIVIKAFVDKRYKEMGSTCGLPIVNKDILDFRKDYVIVSLKKYNAQIMEYLEKHGFIQNKDYVCFYDIYSEWEVN